MPAWLVNVLYYALPNFRNFDFKDRVVYGDAVPWRPWLAVTAYAAAYIGVVLLAGLAAFRSRELSMMGQRLLALVLLPLIPLLQNRIDAQLGVYRAQEEVLYLWSGEHVRRLFPGFEGLAADVYWLRTVQYYGGQRLFAHDKKFELLLPLIEITTTLDPRLVIAYQYGATFLCERPPEGAGRCDQGVAVLEKGVAAMPHDWRLRQDLGFFHFIFRNDPQRAAEILMEAAELPGAAFWLRNLAAMVLAKGGNRESSRAIWRQIYEQSEGHLKENALQHLEVLDAYDAADALQSLVAEMERRTGRRPETLDELRAAGLIRRRPVDESGAPFLYDRESGTVRVSPQSKLWRPDL